MHFVYFILTKKERLNLIFRASFIKSLILILFFSSFSIIKAKNIQLFITDYQNLVFFIILSILIFIFISEYPQQRFILLKIIVISALIDSLFELSIYLNVYRYFQPLIKQENLMHITNSFLKQKSDYPNFSISLFPILFWFLLEEKKNNFFSFISLILLIISVINLFQSNNRTYFLMFIFVIIGTFFIYKEKLSKRLVLTTFFLFLVLIIFYFVNLKSYSPFSTTLLERFFEPEGASTVISRFDIWKHSIGVFLSSPFVGVGLSNFGEYLPVSLYWENFFRKSIYRLNLPPAYVDPHNMFFKFLSETGIFCFSVFIFMFIFFLIKDFKVLTKKNTKKEVLVQKSLIVGFWSLFIYLFLNPINFPKFFLFFSLYRNLLYRR